MSSKHPLLLSLQLFLLFLDLIFNALAVVLYSKNTLLLMIYLLQDTVIVISLIILAILISSTFLFQAGLIPFLVKKFGVSLLAALVYLTLSISYHYLSLSSRWEKPAKSIWSPWMLGLYVAHRIAAVMYYYTYKRTSLLLSDPKYYEISDWLKKKIKEST
ncbi:unnamed protein product [Auanema sp. JU1783]|nr:unnamed protein product [Auanema sp. JU1783]